MDLKSLGGGSKKSNFGGQGGDELKKRKALYKQAVTKLEPREIEILTARRLDEDQ